MCSPKRESQDTDCFYWIRSCNGSTFRSDFTNEHEHHNKDVTSGNFGGFL